MRKGCFGDLWLAKKMGTTDGKMGSAYTLALAVVKAGFAGDDAPCTIFSSLSGRPNHPGMY
jgi:hypothetical protein